MLVEGFSMGLFNPPVMSWQDVKTETYDEWIRFLST
jgi:hypothetical protein